MTHTEVGLFNTTVEESRSWLHDVMQETGLDHHYALQALRGVLHALRDEITADQSGHFAAQMPMLIRGMYFEGWDPSRAPAADQDAERFIERVRMEFAGYAQAVDHQQVIRGVLHALERRMPAVCDKIKHTLPKRLRALWQEVRTQTAIPH